MKQLSIRREWGAGHLNEIVNDPAVRPWVGGGSYRLDLTEIVANHRNVLLMRDGGGVLFHWLADGLYEAHTQFLEKERGGVALTAVRDALHFMFCTTDAVEIVTKVPDGNVPADALTRTIHGQFQFYRPKVWPRGECLVGAKYYNLTLQEWVRTADGLVEIGETFHQKLAEAKQLMGASNPPHDDDNAHDRYVGAACEMILGGQIAKGLEFYRRWALFAGYIPAQLIAINPPVVDIGDCIIAVRQDDFDVLLCR